MDSNEFMSNILVRPEVLGAHAIISHFPDHTSSQRLLMWNNSAAQVEVIAGAEPAFVQTGYETKYGKYEFDESARDQDVQVVAGIPKFATATDNSRIKSNPSYTTVFIGCDDNKVGYFNINEYTELHSGFGYKNKRVTNTYPMEGDYIPRGQKFVTAPNHDGPIYSLGLNANVCYMPMWDTTDDAFIISKSLAKRFTHTVIAKREIIIDKDDQPLNLYSDPDDNSDYRCFPDIGTVVRDDGILIGLRKKDGNAFSTDLTSEELKIPRLMHDNIIKAPPGARVVDVQVYISHKQIRTIDDPCYMQFLEYNKLHNMYYSSIIDAYEEYCVKQGHACTPEFNTLVTRCKCFCYSRGGKSMILVNKKDVIENIHLTITYAYDKPISLGYKLTGTDGSKGVVSAIWEDEDMPVSIHGIRADILITAESPFNRLNGGQLIEQFLTLCSELVAQKVRKENMTTNQAYDYVMDYIETVQPMWGKLIRERCQYAKAEFIEGVKKDGIYLMVPPYCAGFDSNLILKLADKYHIERGPLTYHIRNNDGSRKKIITKCPGIIGAKYLVLLGKRPDDTITAGEFGHMNQFMIPMKPNSKTAKAHSLHGQTPQKYGEDEFRNVAAIAGMGTAVRILGVYGCSPIAMNKLEDLLLTSPYPTALGNIGMTTKEVVDTSTNIGLMQHMLCAIGYRLSRWPDNNPQVTDKK